MLTVPKVVGGGTAGLTIASRLAQAGAGTVAVIEAGGFYEIDNSNLSVVPGYAQSMPFLATSSDYPRQPLMDWGHLSTPQSRAGNRIVHYPQGKTFGGSSATNTLAYHRATLGTYQKWAELVDDSSYFFKNFLPYFQRSSHLTPPNQTKRSTPNATVQYDPRAFTSEGGPLEVSWANWVDPTVTWLQKAFANIGLPPSPVNFNTGFLSGHGAWITSTISPTHAVRSSSQSSYLGNQIETSDIMLYVQTRALRILFDGERAIGIILSTQGLGFTLSATREVIVTSGVFQSPHLLLVSGEQCTSTPLT